MTFACHRCRRPLELLYIILVILFTKGFIDFLLVVTPMLGIEVVEYPIKMISFLLVAASDCVEWKGIGKKLSFTNYYPWIRRTVISVDLTVQWYSQKMELSLTEIYLEYISVIAVFNSIILYYILVENNHRLVQLKSAADSRKVIVLEVSQA